MADSKYFGIPFATSGDKAAIPEATQPSGAVSYTQGFGPDYERNPSTDPLAKRVPRDETNELYFEITNSLKFLQLYGTPEWYEIDDAGNPVSYPLSARVRHDAGSGMQAWRSLIANNTAEPGTDAAKWALDTPFDISTSEATLAEAVAGASGTKIITPRRLASSTQRSAWNFAVAGGSADAITASFSPAVVLLTNGLSVRVRATAANMTTSPTFTPNSGTIAPSPIKKGTNLNLAPGDIPGAGFWMELTYDLSSDVWVLKNPASGVIPQQLHQVFATVAANAFTMGWTGGNLSFRSANAANGSIASISSGALSLTVPAGATLGTVSGVISQVLILVLYNDGNPVLGVVHATTTGSVNLDETGVISSSAIGGGASSANVVYSAVPVTNSPYRVVGYALITETTPGVWASPPSKVQPMGAVSVLSLVSTAAGFSTAFGPAGYQRLPTGLIYQWGFVTNTGSQNSGSGSFPITFPNACRGVWPVRSATNAAAYAISINWGTSGFGWYDSGSSFPSFGWFAVGN